MLKSYVKPENFETLRNFKYSGVNLSILYNWILGDFA